LKKLSSVIFEGWASNSEAHNLTRFIASLGAGRHLWFRTPYSINIFVNILVDEYNLAGCLKKDNLSIHGYLQI
jgi:hypothetical protein